MKKQLKTGPAPYRAVSSNDAQRFRGSIVTVFSNFGALACYGTILKLSVDATMALIVFSIMAVLQFVICIVIALNYNSKMWLVSAFMIFLAGCGVVLYSSM